MALSTLFEALGSLLKEFLWKAVVYSPDFVAALIEECRDTDAINRLLERYEAAPGDPVFRLAVAKLLARKRRNDPDRAREIEEHLRARGLDVPAGPA